MMNLLVDIGNSRVKWCRAAGQALVETGSLPHAGDALPDTLESHWRQLAAPERIVIASVAGPVLNHALDQLCQSIWSLTPRFLGGEAAQLGVRNAYHTPANLGPDRWAALIGAWIGGMAPCCIVDAGTAVTVDVLDASGAHHGGMIFAGLGLSRRALTERAHRLPPIGDGPLPTLAADTPEAIRLGTYQALVGGVEHALRQVLGRYGDMAILLTGGDAELLAAGLAPREVVVRSDLVFAGLAAVAEEHPG